jgi:hypothetical protein
MPAELECPICDADIPLEGTEVPGDLVLQNNKYER